MRKTLRPLGFLFVCMILLASCEQPLSVDIAKIETGMAEDKDCINCQPLPEEGAADDKTSTDRRESMDADNSPEKIEGEINIDADNVIEIVPGHDIDVGNNTESDFESDREPEIGVFPDEVAQNQDKDENTVVGNDNEEVDETEIPSKTETPSLDESFVSTSTSSETQKNGDYPNNSDEVVGTGTDTTRGEETRPENERKDEVSESAGNTEKDEGSETKQEKSAVIIPIKVILDGVYVQLADGRVGPYINCAWLDGEPLELVDGRAEIQIDQFDVDHVLRVAYISDYGDFQITFADVTTMIAAEPGKDVRISGSIPEITVSVQFVPTLVIE